MLMDPRGGERGAAAAAAAAAAAEEENRNQAGWTRKPVWTFMEKRKYEGRRRYLN
jgi:hypothetical protein